jgi:hypothetical protein
MDELRARLPAPPVRIFFVSDNATLRTRGAYFLYPHNVFFQWSERMRFPSYDAVRAGDHVLLLFHDGLRYLPAEKRLAWPDGRSKAVRELFFAPGGPALLQVS